MIEAARYAHVPPDWFLDKSIFWLEAVLSVREINAEVEKHLRGDGSGGGDSGSNASADSIARAREGIGGYDQWGNIIPLR